MECLVTTLKDAVDNDGLLKLGEWRIDVDSPSDVAYIRIATLGSTTMNARIVGEGYFTNEAGTTNLGKTKTFNTTTTSGEVLYLSPGEYYVLLSNKANIGVINATNGVSLDMASLIGMERFNFLLSTHLFLRGSVEYFKYTSINYFNVLNQNELYGNIKDGFAGKLSTFGITNNHSLTGTLNDLADCFNEDRDTYDIIISGSNITGNVSALSGIADKLRRFSADSTAINGSLSAFSGMTALTRLDLSSTSVTGDTSSLANLTNLTTFTYTNTAITGTWPLT